MKLKVSEIFYSLQGEGLHQGIPSIFLRVFGCNFTCSGFNMPKGMKSKERLDVDAERFSTYSSLPLVHTGCDSYPSWDTRFKHLSPMMSVSQIADRIEELLPNKVFENIHLVITGGEPLLPRWQKNYIDLFEEFKNRNMDLRFVTFETNGTQYPDSKLISYFNDNEYNLNVSIALSVKLTCSGEEEKDRIKPDAIVSWFHQFSIDNIFFKFVVNTMDDLNEIEYIRRTTTDQIPVYIMPVGGTIESYEMNERWVAKEALKRGYRFSPRLHIKLYGNSWGT